MRGSNMRDRFDVEVVFSSRLPRRFGTAFRGLLGKSLGVDLLLLTLAIEGPHGLAAQAFNLEDQKAIMQAQIELLHKEAELQSAMRQAHVGQALNLPQVVSIAWVAGRYIARLDLGQGVQGNFLQGERVQDELSIQSISQERVSVSWRHGKKYQTLPLRFLNAQETRPGAPNPKETLMGGLSSGLNLSPLPVELLGSLPAVNFPPTPPTQTTSPMPNPYQPGTKPQGSAVSPTNTNTHTYKSEQLVKALTLPVQPSKLPKE